MRSCEKCFNYAYVFVGGEVRCCSWNTIVLGNLNDNTLEDIWHGEKADQLRQSFMKGDLIGCNEEYCPYCINHSDWMEFTEDELENMYRNVPEAPTTISLAYDERCNHACPSCRHEILCPDQEYKDQVKRISANIEPYLDKVANVTTNGIGDLYATPDILDMLSRLQPKNPNFDLFIETNGVLFKDNWHKIEHLSKYPIMLSITPNSFDRETYRYLAGKDDLAKLEESLYFIRDLKREKKIDKVRIIMVIQDSNFRQIPNFIERCLEFEADEIVLRPIFWWFGLQEDEFMFKNVLNPCHPYHKEYMEIIQHPLCRHEKILNWGFDVPQDPVPLPTMEMKRACDGINRLKCRVGAKVPEIKEWVKKKGEGKKLVIYGAGNVGKILLEMLTCGQDTVPVECYAVTELPCGIPVSWMGYPIVQLDQLPMPYDECLFIIATVECCYKFDMEKALKDLGAEDYFSIV